MGGGAHHEVAALLLEGELARESLRLHRRAVLAADDHLGAWVLGNVQEKSALLCRTEVRPQKARRLHALPESSKAVGPR